MSDSMGNWHTPRSARLARAYCEGRTASIAGLPFTAPYTAVQSPDENRAWARGHRSYKAGGSTVIKDNCARNGLFTPPTVTATPTGKSVAFAPAAPLPIDYEFGDGQIAADLDGTITHVYARSGTYNVRIHCYTSIQDISVDVDLLVEDNTLGPFSVEQGAAADFDLTGGWTAGEAPYTYTTATVLPEDLVLGASTGHITGTATADPGVTAVTVTCTDDVGTALSQTFNVTITAP